VDYSTGQVCSDTTVCVVSVLFRSFGGGVDWLVGNRTTSEKGIMYADGKRDCGGRIITVNLLDTMPADRAETAPWPHV
jgi:hypothetical protein